MVAQSRTRLIQPGKQDNAGFAGWAAANAIELFKLGPGLHFGEWWGKGIQRGYGLDTKKFSLFNTSRWKNERPACCDVVPVLFEGKFNEPSIVNALEDLRLKGSIAAPGFMKPEGIVIYHVAANQLFKVTLEKDELPKALAFPQGE